jgi:hypothetical protein
VRAQLLGALDAPPRDGGRVAWRAVVPTTPALEAACPRGESLMAASAHEGKTMTLMCAARTAALRAQSPHSGAAGSLGHGCIDTSPLRSDGRSRRLAAPGT